MPESNGEVRFNNDQVLVGDVGHIDELQGVVRGVSLIKKGEAEGHGLVVDDVLLKQLQACGKSKGKIPVNLDHGSGITSTCGFITGFRIDQDKLRGDLHLLKAHPEYKVLLERADRMPECFGLSVAFRPPDGNKTGDPLGGGKYAARCEDLRSVDLVCRPAANDSLFSVPSVDNLKNGMAKEKTPDPNAGGQEKEPTLAEVLAAVQQLSERLDQQDQFNQQVVDHLNTGNEPSLQDLVEASDEELAQLGLTRDEVNAAVQEVVAGMESEGLTGEGQGQGQGEGELATAGAGAAQGGADFSPAGATSGTASNLSALQKDLVQLKNKLALKEFNEKKQAEDLEFAAIEEKIMVLARQRDEAIKNFEEMKAKNEALEVHLKTGTRPVRAGVDNGMRMFSADTGGLHEFQVRVKQLKESGKTEGEAVTLAQKENPALHADWVQSLRRKPVAA